MVCTQTFGIIDAGAIKQTQAHFGLAAKWLVWELGKLGAKLAQPADADVVLVSVVSPSEPDCVPRTLKKCGVSPIASHRLRQKVVLGGGGAMSPAVFDPYVDLSCVGEGRALVRTLVQSGLAAAKSLPNAWVPGETRKVIPDYDFPWDIPPTKAEDGIVKVYASRGCKKKCLFCHTGWSVPLREANPLMVKNQCAAVKRAGHRINIVTNDAADLSLFDGAIPENFSASYSQLKLAMQSNGAILKGAKGVRIGVEAPSERLRKFIGKPMTNDDLFKLSVRLLDMGIGVRWFMIAGLPGERDSDYDELKGLILRAKQIAKGVLQISFTAFCPDASAPLALLPLTDDYWPRFERFWKWYFEGPGFTRKVQLMRCAAPASRLEHAMASMAASEAQLRKGWADQDPPNWRVQYAYQGSARAACAAYWRKVCAS